MEQVQLVMEIRERARQLVRHLDHDTFREALAAPSLAAYERGEVAAWCVLHADAEHVGRAERVAVRDHVRVHHLLQDAHLIDRRLTILAAEATEAHLFHHERLAAPAALD